MKRLVWSKSVQVNRGKEMNMGISAEQKSALFAALGANGAWDSLTTEQVQVGIREAHTFAAKEFIELILNGFRLQVGGYFRETGEFTIQIPALPQPTLAELRAKFPWIKEEGGIECEASPTEAIALKLGTVLRPNETSINGPEYEQRLAPKSGLLLGYQHAQWFVKHQDEFPELTALLRKVYIDFPGLVVVSEDGHRFFPYLSQVVARWGVRWLWLAGGFRPGGRVAVSGK